MVTQITTRKTTNMILREMKSLLMAHITITEEQTTTIEITTPDTIIEMIITADKNNNKSKKLTTPRKSPWRQTLTMSN